MLEVALKISHGRWGKTTPDTSNETAFMGEEGGLEATQGGAGSAHKEKQEFWRTSKGQKVEGHHPLKECIAPPSSLAPRHLQGVGLYI